MTRRVELVQIGYAADRLGVSRQRVDVLSRGDAFPKPAAIVNGERCWLRSELDAWVRRRQRTQQLTVQRRGARRTA